VDTTKEDLIFFFRLWVFFHRLLSCASFVESICYGLSILPSDTCTMSLKADSHLKSFQDEEREMLRTYA